MTGPGHQSPTQRTSRVYWWDIYRNMGKELLTGAEMTQDICTIKIYCRIGDSFQSLGWGSYLTSANKKNYLNDKSHRCRIWLPTGSKNFQAAVVIRWWVDGKLSVLHECTPTFSPIFKLTTGKSYDWNKESTHIPKR